MQFGIEETADYSTCFENIAHGNYMFKLRMRNLIVLRHTQNTQKHTLEDPNSG